MDNKEIIEVIELLMSTPEHSEKHWKVIEKARFLIEQLKQVETCSIPYVNRLVLLSKPNYKGKDGRIKRGIEIEGKYYAPQNDC